MNVYVYVGAFAEVPHRVTRPEARFFNCTPGCARHHKLGFAESSKFCADCGAPVTVVQETMPAVVERCIPMCLPDKFDDWLSSPEHCGRKDATYSIWMPNSHVGGRSFDSDDVGEAPHYLQPDSEAVLTSAFASKYAEVFAYLKSTYDVDVAIRYGVITYTH